MTIFLPSDSSIEHPMNNAILHSPPPPMRERLNMVQNLSLHLPLTSTHGSPPPLPPQARIAPPRRPLPLEREESQRKGRFSRLNPFQKK